jgi:hypothetical protein
MARMSKEAPGVTVQYSACPTQALIRANASFLGRFQHSDSNAHNGDGSWDYCVSVDACFSTSNSAPTISSCYRHGLGPLLEPDERMSRGRAVRSGHGEELTGPGSSGLRVHTRRAEQNYHGLGRVARRCIWLNVQRR